MEQPQKKNKRKKEYKIFYYFYDMKCFQHVSDKQMNMLLKKNNNSRKMFDFFTWGESEFVNAGAIK